MSGAVALAAIAASGYQAGRSPGYAGVPANAWQLQAMFQPDDGVLSLRREYCRWFASVGIFLFFNCEKPL